MSTTITGLPNATTPLSGNERVPMDQAGTTKDATTQDIANLAAGTDLSYDAATRLLVSSTGTDVTLPLATDALAGLMSGAQRLLNQALIDAGVSVTGSTVTIPHIHGDLAGSIYIHVKNTSGAELTKGTPVRVTGAVGDTTTLEVAAAQSSGTGTMPAVGILSDTLAINASGHCVVAGELTGLATGSHAVGQTLYVASGGGLTGTLPTTGVAQAVAIVGRVHASTGSVTVTIGTPTTAGAGGVVTATAPATYDPITQTVGVTLGTTAGTAAAGDDARFDIAVVSDVTGIAGADSVTNVVSLTQAEYDAIASPNASTLYVITD